MREGHQVEILREVKAWAKMVLYQMDNEHSYIVQAINIMSWSDRHKALKSVLLKIMARTEKGCRSEVIYKPGLE